MRVRRAVLAVLAMPAAAALAIGGVLVASGHTTVPPLVPARSPATTRPAQAAGAGPCAGGLPEPFAGVAVNPGIRAHVASFERATGAHVRVAEFYNAFDAPFQKWEAQQALAANALPLIQLNPRDISLALIAAGRYDAHLRQYADAVRAYGCRVALSFGHEMNGWWYTWGRPWTTPATFIAAWRHIHDVFAARHVTNVIWSWDPTHQYKQYQHGKVASFASEWFPGNAYVDWIGVDGYLGAGQGFADVFGRQLRDIR